MNVSPIKVDHAASSLSFAAFSVQGVKRRENGDRYLVRDRLALVADGISSSSLGAESANTCVAYVGALWAEQPQLADTDAVNALLRQVNGHLLSRAMMLPSNERRRGGCCVAGVVLSNDGGSALVFHAGDAGVHIIGRNGFRKLTTDHHGTRNDRGRNNRIRSALGIVPDPEIAVAQVELMPGDHLVLATDGCDLSSLTQDPVSASVSGADAIVAAIRAINSAPTDDATVVVLSSDCAG